MFDVPRLSVPVAVRKALPARDMKRFQAPQRAHALLVEEPALLDVVQVAELTLRCSQWRLG